MTATSDGLSINNGSLGPGAGVGLLVATGKVGIGTTSPSSVLDISGTNAGGTVRIFDQTATTGVTRGLIRAGAGQTTSNLLEFQNNAGTVTSSVNSSGFWLQPGTPTAATLQAATTSYVDSAVSGASGNAVNKDGTTQLTGNWNVGNRAVSNISTLSVGSNTAPTGGVAYFNGNVGIGTTNPGQKLHVSGSGNIGVDGGQGLSFGNAWTTSIIGSGFNAGGDYLQFSTANSARMYINNAGNVGVGTTSPQSKLDINGALSFKAAGGTSSFANGFNGGVDLIYSSGGIFRMTEFSVFGTNDIFFQAYPATASGYGYLEAWQAAGMVVGTGNATPVIFRPNRTEAMRITSGGNVGIGTTAPTERLNIAGNMKVESGQAFVNPQTSSVASPLDFDANLGNMMTWTTNTANPVININNMKAGGSYALIIEGTGTGVPTINCWSGVGTGAITARALPALNTRTPNGSIYNIMTNGTNCYITWASGF